MRYRCLIAIFISLGSLSCQNEVKVAVSSVHFWTDSQIEVRAGQTVIIKATGEVYGRYAPPEHVWGPIGPKGQTDELADSLWMLPGAPKIALIGKIGEEGNPFKIGNETKISVVLDGRLFLGVNDRVYLHPADHHYVEGNTQQMHTGCYEDNRGEFKVQIKISDL